MAKKNPNETFLAAFRRFEDEIKKADPERPPEWASANLWRSLNPPIISPYDIEQAIIAGCPDISEKLKVCRIVRNYLVHSQMDKEPFIEASPSMTAFIETVANDIASMHKTAKDIMKKVRPLERKTTLAEAAKALRGRKLEWLPVIDNGGFIECVFTKEAFFNAVTDGMALKTTLLEASNRQWSNGISMIGDNLPAESAKAIAQEGKYVIVNGKDGRPKGIILP